MKRPTKKPRPWRASLIAKRMRLLGRVHAPDRAAAEPAAVEEFKLNDQQCRRLVIEPGR